MFNMWFVNNFTLCAKLPFLFFSSQSGLDMPTKTHLHVLL